jgi:hypothetical protein
VDSLEVHSRPRHACQSYQECEDAECDRQNECPIVPKPSMSLQKDGHRRKRSLSV